MCSIQFQFFLHAMNNYYLNRNTDILHFLNSYRLINISREKNISNTDFSFFFRDSIFKNVKKFRGLFVSGASFSIEEDVVVSPEAPHVDGPFVVGVALVDSGVALRKFKEYK